jgi:predicted dehydrogenase
MTGFLKQLNGFPGARVKVGVIGCGYWGPQLIRNFATLPQATLMGVADHSQERLDYVQSQYPGVRRFKDHRDLLSSDIDAVVIATPIHTHYQIAKEALEAGKHVLVEKPLTASLADALELNRLAEEHHLTLMVGHTFIYNPAVEELCRLVQGDLGRVFYVDAARLNLGLFQSRNNVIWDLGPHDVSIITYVLGRKPVAVRASGSSCVQPGVHDVAYVEVEFEGGVRAQIHLSWLDPAKVRRITVVGDRRMVVYNDVSLGEKIKIYNKGVETPVTDDFGEFQLSYRHGEVTIPYIEWREPLALECDHFVDSIRTSSRPRTDGYQGLSAVAVLEAATHSLLHQGEWQKISLPEWPLMADVRPEDILPGVLQAQADEEEVLAAAVAAS